MLLFKKQKQQIDRAEARRIFVQEVNDAVAKARECAVDPRDLSNDLEGLASALRMAWATTAPYSELMAFPVHAPPSLTISAAISPTIVSATSRIFSHVR